MSSGGSSGNEVPEEHPESPQKGNDMDEDDPPTGQVLHNQEPGDTPPAILIEVDEDGKETIISDHSTSAGFTFQNSLIYELD